MQAAMILLLIFAFVVQVPGFYRHFNHIALKTATLQGLNMAATGGQTSGESKTGVGTLIKQDTKVKPTFKEEIEKNWRLLLHDDDIHTIEEVCDIVAGICPLCPGPRAYEVTMQVHLTGAGTICSANKKIVQEVHCKPKFYVVIVMSPNISL